MKNPLESPMAVYENIVILTGVGISAESGLDKKAGSRNLLHMHGELIRQD